MELVKPNTNSLRLYRIKLFEPTILSAGKPKGGKDKPYIAGHITDGASTFTFTVNGNESVTVPVDANGNWLWVVDREVTSLASAFAYLDNLDSIAFVGINLTIIQNFQFVIRQTEPYQTYRIVDMSKCKGSVTTPMNYAFYRSKTMWYMPNIDVALSDVTLQSWSDVRACGYIKANINFGNLGNMSQEGVVSMFDKVAADGLTLTFHPKVGATIDAALEAGGEGTPEQNAIYKAYWDAYDRGYEINYTY